MTAIWVLAGTAFPQKAVVPKQQDKVAIAREKVRRTVALDGYRQEREDFQARMDEVYGSGV
ncbi:MAG TPA: hypothetical protein VEI50_16435 [Nitrospiraceae bacterium]|nr:hypothetical protein [Nitrospiraceae bacterium]